MIIAVDGNEANVREPVGVSVYTSQLLLYFSKAANAKQRFIVFLKNKPLELLPKEGEYYKYEVVKGPFLWSQIFLPLRLMRWPNFDVFFAPAHYLPRFCPVPTVVTIHDLSYFYYPNEFLKKDLYKLTRWTKSAVEKAYKIIAVSKNTKKDILKQYGVAEEKVQVIYNGFQKRTFDRPRTMNYELQSKSYILFTGTIQPRKNIITLIDAFKKFQLIYPEYKLVLSGKKGWLYEQTLAAIKSSGVNDKIVLTGYVSDDELIYLYKHAFCFVTPSLYEGFGIPILEAMSYNCPVISSFASSLPEIGDDACLYFDPKSPQELCDKMIELKKNPFLVKSLVKKGIARIRDFSWEKCAKETLSVITNIVKNEQ